MKIKLKTLNIRSYDAYDKRQIKFVKEMKEDPLIIYYVTSELDKYLDIANNSDKILSNAIYIITDNKTPIGFIRVVETDEKDTLELHYGVHADHRKKGYGSKILLEVGNYLLDNKNINKLKLEIKKINNSSIKCALKANYHLEKTTIIGDTKLLTYVKEKK